LEAKDGESLTVLTEEGFWAFFFSPPDDYEQRVDCQEKEKKGEMGPIPIWLRKIVSRSTEIVTESKKKERRREERNEKKKNPLRITTSR
jgi:hypothetical protein